MLYSFHNQSLKQHIGSKTVKVRISIEIMAFITANGRIFAKRELSILSEFAGKILVCPYLHALHQIQICIKFLDNINEGSPGQALKRLLGLRTFGSPAAQTLASHTSFAGM